MTKTTKKKHFKRLKEDQIGSQTLIILYETYLFSSHPFQRWLKIQFHIEFIFFINLKQLILKLFKVQKNVSLYFHLNSLRNEF